MPRFRLAIALLLSASGLSGCAERFDATQLGVPVTLASPAGQPAQGEPFKVNGSSIHLVLGVFSIHRPSLEKVLAGQLVGGKGVADLKIRVRSRWSDVLISGLTLGLVIPRTITFEGVITNAPGQQAQPPE